MCENCPLKEENNILHENNAYLNEEILKLVKSRDTWRNYAGELALTILGVKENA